MTETATPETEQQSHEEPQEPADGPTTSPSGAEAPEEPQQPAEAVSLSRDVVTQTPAGSLTLRPNQTELDPEQHWALKAIGIDTVEDPLVIPHLRAFVHMCQIRALDPFAREAYLIGRGAGSNRKFTMQTGIDGYRKMAKMTGRFIRIKATYWTGADDDDRSYRAVEIDGDYIMKRVWYDQWPASRGNPGAAKVVIEHYDDDNNITTTDAVADWGMYAPYNDVWEGPRGNRQKKVVGGEPVRELSEMWQKGGPHMLAKCAEALAHRKAFPNAVNGFYVTEEMHRLDQDERERKTNQKGAARREAYEAAQREQRTATPVVDEPKPEADVVDADVVEDAPTPVAETVEQVVAQAKVDTVEVLRLLHAEFEWQAEAMGQTPAALASRWVKRHRKNLVDFTAEEMMPLVNGLRSMAAEAATRAGLDDAEAYAAVALDGAGPIDVEALSPEDADPDGEHLFVATAEGDECFTCGLREDVGNHREPEGEEA